jgi:hypothetical protein
MIQVTKVETKPNTVNLVLLGRTQEGEPLYWPLDTFTPKIEKELEKAGFRYEGRTLESGRVASGWLPPSQKEPKPEPSTPVLVNIKAVKVKSDSSDVEYTVAVDVDRDEALDCSCPAGQKKTSCKHLYRGRVKAAGTFAEAATKLIQYGAFLSKENFYAEFDKRVQEKGTNVAIAMMIRAGLGESHPHAYPLTKR